GPGCKKAKETGSEPSRLALHCYAPAGEESRDCGLTARGSVPPWLALTCGQTSEGAAFLYCCLGQFAMVGGGFGRASVPRWIGDAHGRYARAAAEQARSCDVCHGAETCNQISRVAVEKFSWPDPGQFSDVGLDGIADPILGFDSTCHEPAASR